MELQTQIMDGTAMAREIRKGLSKEVQELVKAGKRPGLAVVLVGEDPASQVYVKMKKRGCKEVGIDSREYLLPDTTSQEQLLKVIDDLNEDPSVHGILVQLPLPQGLDEQEVINRINPLKDIDGFHPVNVGKLYIGLDTYVPCTPAGVIEMLQQMNYDISGKKAVVLGRSNIVGKPVAQLLLQQNATVTVCHSRTKNLKEECRQADILIAAVGQSELVKADWVKPGAVVIDVGINRVDGKLVGDVAFDELQGIAGWITPVPGGVGPMTISMLLKNTVKAARG